MPCSLPNNERFAPSHRQHERSSMKTRKLGRTDLQVSEIGFGALEIGRPWGLPIEGDFAIPSEREVQALLDRTLALGINFIVTAPAYMLSEERLGRLLKHRRKEFYLASKCGEYFDGYESRYDFSITGTLQFIETSLRRLQTDYLDLVQIHCGPNEVEQIGRGEALADKLRKAAPGDDPAIAKVLGLIARLEQRGVQTPLSQIAIQFVLRKPVGTVLVGTRNFLHLEDAVQAARQPLDGTLLQELEVL